MTTSAVSLHGARYESGRVCVHCGEPLVRLLRDGESPSRWLHTPNRLNCLSPFREVTDRVATPRPLVVIPS